MSDKKQLNWEELEKVSGGVKVERRPEYERALDGGCLPKEKPKVNGLIEPATNDNDD